MKIFNKFTLFISIILISTVVSSPVDNQITYYGCPDDCTSQDEPACDIKIDTEYFAALANKYPKVKSHCGQYVVVMPTNGSKKIVKAKVVDTCEDCDPYHVDLSTYAFGAIVNLDDGIAEVIWALYSSNGQKVDGPHCNDFDSAAKKVGMTRSAYIASFEVSAENLVKSKNDVGVLSSSGKENIPEKNFNSPNQTESSTNKETKTTHKSSSTLVNKPTTTDTQSIKSISEIENKDNDNDVGTKIGIITAVGGTCLGAAGVGLLLIKKKNPNKYENLKQKFPDTFNQVKRSISRGTTALKRKVTKREPNPNVIYA
ncbi:hypothetical protein PIROE2DRAFT_20085 [Piromyces sp. E2]|nr:hypothetical protein PIROE2DRAFT_20085 [Piromyces sp. E2]|eukprot:OUM67003.1 hypothetical protein PIROE2DRAFT_20085 [Piromyces sp. E2]